MTNEEVAVELTNHSDRLEVVEKDVENFRSFQSKMNRKIGFVYGVSWVLSIVGSALFAIFIWALGIVVPAAKAVVSDYYRDHPKAAVEQNSQKRIMPPMFANAQEVPQKTSSINKDQRKNPK
jgi:tetrahydromethanopterin S-methyltransferase subunit G